MLVKQATSQTNFVLPTKILTKSGYVLRNRYYENEFELFKAYRQLKHINIKNMIVLYPVVY